MFADPSFRRPSQRDENNFSARPVLLVPIAVLMIGAVLFWVSPFWSMAGLFSAAQNRDVDAFADYVDMPRIKEEMRVRSHTNYQSKLDRSNSILGPLLFGIAMEGTDKAIERISSSEILESVANGMPKESASQFEFLYALIRNARVEWETLGTARFLFGAHDEFEWHLHREWLTWKVTYMGSSPAVTVPGGPETDRKSRHVTPQERRGRTDFNKRNALKAYEVDFRKLYVKCGDSFYTKVENTIYQERGVTFEVSSMDSLNESDRANGYQWKGSVLHKARMERYYQGSGSWSEWHPFEPGLPADVYSKNGEWGSDMADDNKGLSRIECSEIPAG